MGTRGLFVFRIKGKVVAQVHTQGDGYPSGFPQDIAKLLYELVGDVQVHNLIITIIATIKECVGTIYMAPVTHPYDTKANYPWMEYCYVFDFDEEVKIECRELCGPWKMYTIPAFSSLCENEISTDYKQPTLKYDTPVKDSDDKAYVVMLNENGEPFFVLVVKEWLKDLEEFVLNIDLCNGLGGCAEIGVVANGNDCLAAQVLKKVHKLCLGNAEILPLDAVDYGAGAMPIHTISFYKVPGMIAAHDEDNEGTFAPRDDVQGIHSLTEDGASVKKGRYNPPKPSIKRKYDNPIDDEKIINKKIKVNAYTKDYADSPNICKGDEGTLLFTSSHGADIFFLTIPRIAVHSCRAAVSLTTALSSPLLLTREEDSKTDSM